MRARRAVWRWSEPAARTRSRAHPGNDFMIGGAGADTFVFGAAFGNDVIADFAAAGAAHDIIDFHAISTLNSFASVQSHTTQVGSASVISDGSGNTLTLNNVSQDQPDVRLISHSYSAVASGAMQLRREQPLQQRDDTMCGIVGVISSRPAAPVILDSLHRLEYRGYDSAGIATLVDGQIERRRAEGKLSNLAGVLARSPLVRHHRHRPHAMGDAWRTNRDATRIHMAPRACPSCTTASSRTTPNSRSELEAAGQRFTTETDTETVAQFVDLNLQRGMEPDRSGERGVASPGRHLRAGDDLLRPSRPHYRRAARRTTGRRLRRRRDVRRLRRSGPGAADRSGSPI